MGTWEGRRAPRLPSAAHRVRRRLGSRDESASTRALSDACVARRAEKGEAVAARRASAGARAAPPGRPLG